MPRFAPKTSTDLQSLIAEIVQGWACRDIYVPASGNFALERTVLAPARFYVHGGDSTLLAGATGSYLAGQPFRAVLQASARESFAWLEPYLEEQASAVAALALIVKMAPTFQRSNAYYRRLQAAYEAQFPAMHAKIVGKLAGQPLRLASFYLGGVREYLGDIPEDGGIVTHAGLWKADVRVEDTLATLIDWDRPEVVPIVKRADIQEAAAQIAQREHWALISPHEVPALEDSLRSTARTTNRGPLTYVYASCGPQRIIRPSQRIDPILAPHLTVGQQLGKELRVALVPSAQFNALRAAYLNAAIQPSSKAPLACAVLVDGVIIGGFAVAPDAMPGMWWGAHVAEPLVYLLSDFAVGPTDYPRLSKLVVAAALSTETRLLIERRFANIRRSVVTTVFSRRPNSMKYRGLLELFTREEIESPEVGGKGYKLGFGGPLGRWSLEEAYAEWQAKHGARKLPASETATTPTS